VSLKEETKLTLKKHGIKPNKRLGQNFIIDRDVLLREISHADIKKSDKILEIGSGIGTLTELLAKHAGNVYVVEADARMVEILKERVGGNVEIIKGDVLKVKLPEFDKVVSNIPYSISSPLTFRLLAYDFKMAIITYQKEFAERMVAKPGKRNYSRLSVATYYHADAEILEVLPPGAFYPAPDVDSAIVKLTPKKRKPFKVNESLFFDLLRGLFSHKKKTLKKALFFALSDVFDMRSKEKRKEILDTFDENLTKRRVFTLTPEELADICDELEGKL
jgi:16S rRNA (adenine1518-N6/adenine1519-N6)-dimethyltransferase